MQNYIGDARREYASKHGKFTQEDAAEYFGVSLSTYKKWEQGQGMMNGEQLRAIARKYETTTDFLLGITYSFIEVPDENGLFSDERELLSCYQRMDSADKSAFLDMARTLALAGDVKKKDARGAASGDVEVVSQ